MLTKLESRYILHISLDDMYRDISPWGASVGREGLTLQKHCASQSCLASPSAQSQCLSPVPQSRAQ
jgi:hypothetical protein